MRDMLRNKAQKKEWGGIKRTMDTCRSGAVTEVDNPIEGEEAIHCHTEETVEETLREEISKRFERANSAPICQGALFNLLGYGANTETAEKILDGTFDPPKGTDGPTVILLEEIAQIWKKMGEGEVTIAVSKEDFHHYWKIAKERTSLSYSGIHFGHYKATSHSCYETVSHHSYR